MGAVMLWNEAFFTGTPLPSQQQLSHSNPLKILFPSGLNKQCKRFISKNFQQCVRPEARAQLLTPWSRTENIPMGQFMESFRLP